MIYIDVTKDGWLADQWREKPEREALARLRGETEERKEREIEAVRKSREKRKAPKTSGGVLVDLWNDLAETTNQEVCAVSCASDLADWDTVTRKLFLVALRLVRR